MNLRRRWLRAGVAAATLGGAAFAVSRAAAQPAPGGAGRDGKAARPLRVGIVPYLSARTMVGLYQPLRQHLERALKRPVTLYSATDFAALAENMRANEYDLALMPPHLARIAIADWGCVFVARTARMSAVHLLVPRGAPAPSAQSLRGARIAAIDRLSITTLVLHRWLLDQGLVPDRDVRIDFVRSATTGVLSVARGEADATVAATGMLRDIAQMPDSVRVALKLADIPTPVFIARPGQPPAVVAAMRDALLSFKPAARDGGLSQSPYGAGSMQDLDMVEAYAELARRLLRR